MLGQENFGIALDDRAYEQFYKTTDVDKRLTSDEDGRILKTLDKHAAELENRDSEKSQIAEHIERIAAGQRLNLDFMVSFGVDVHNRESLHEVIKEAVQYGMCTVSRYFSSTFSM